jgi:hypothetical protein
LAATPTTLNFGSVVQGWTTDGRSFELSNDGFGELTISSIAFEVGSSSQIRFAEVPDLPVKLSPGDTPVRVTLVMEASTLGSQSATVLVGTDGVDGPLGQDGVGRVSVRGLVVDCESGCPMQNATPSCAVNNECRIDRCDDRFHNADLSVGNGCECGEDLIPAAAGARRDVPGVCGGQSLGDLGDECSSRPSEARFTGTIHGRDDVDLFFYRAFDDSSFPTCDVTSDSFRASVRIEGAPAGLRVCARGAQNAGCGGENQRTCGGTALTVKDGSFGNDDDRDVTVWVEWTPGQEQDICASYTLVARARK